MAPMRPLLGRAFLSTLLLVALLGTFYARAEKRAPCKSPELVADVDGDGTLETARLVHVGDDAWAEVTSAGQLWSTVRLGPWHEGATLDVVDINGDESPDLIQRWSEHGAAHAQLWVADEDGFHPEESAGLASTVCLAQR